VTRSEVRQKWKQAVMICADNRRVNFKIGPVCLVWHAYNIIRLSALAELDSTIETAELYVLAKIYRLVHTPNGWLYRLKGVEANLGEAKSGHNSKDVRYCGSVGICILQGNLFPGLMRGHLHFCLTSVFKTYMYVIDNILVCS
jgi:hypothetical protein